MFWIDFLRCARQRAQSDDAYARFQRLQAEKVFIDMQRYFPIRPDDRFLDLGCGIGGYTEFFAGYFDDVTGADYFTAPTAGRKASYVSADLLTLRLERPADIVFSSSTIEHVESKQRFINSIKQNLSIGGYLYLSFPPFYSIRGGHHVSPFHYFPEDLAIWLGKKSGRVGKGVTGYRDLFHTWGLYRTTIGNVRSLLQTHGFDIIESKPRFMPARPVNLARLPVISELLTWHVEFYCKHRTL